MAGMIAPMIGIGIFLLTAYGTEAIKCYECETPTSGCDDKFSSTGIPITNCTNMCSKMKGKREGFPGLIRGCPLEGYPVHEGCAKGTYGPYEGDACFCSTDLCNGSTILQVSITCVLGFVLGSMLLRHVND